MAGREKLFRGRNWTVLCIHQPLQHLPVTGSYRWGRIPGRYMVP